MRPSPLQLDSYHVAELHFAEQEYRPEGQRAGVTVADLNVEVSSLIHKENSLERMCELVVELSDAAAKDFPYSFRVVLVGFFEISENYPAEQADMMFNANAPALLYSAARELLSLISGRSFSAPILLPSVTFIQPARSAEAAPPPEAVKPAGKKAAAKGGARTSRKK